MKAGEKMLQLDTGSHPNASFSPFENCLKPVFNSFQGLNLWLLSPPHGMGRDQLQLNIVLEAEILETTFFVPQFLGGSVKFPGTRNVGYSFCYETFPKTKISSF